MQQDIVSQGVELMLFGMGTVVIFLALLVVATTAMSGFVSRFFPEAAQPATAPAKAAPAKASPEGEVIAAISAAVHQHRNRKA